MDDILNKSISELETILREKRADLMKFRFESTGGKVKNVKHGRILRRDIAKILTRLASDKKN